MNIVLIDDNSTIGNVIEMVLKKSGSIMPWDSIDKFTRAEEFESAFNKKGIDTYGVVICDHDLGPDQPKGYDIMMGLKNGGYNGTLILLTGDDSSSMALRMEETAGIKYVVKNFSCKDNNAYDRLSTLIAEARE